MVVIKILRGKSPAVLYFWNKIKEHGLTESVTQQLNISITIDSFSLPESSSVSTNKKRKMEEDIKMIRLKNSIDKANKIAHKTLKVERKK